MKKRNPDKISYNMENFLLMTATANYGKLDMAQVIPKTNQLNKLKPTFIVILVISQATGEVDCIST